MALLSVNFVLDKMLKHIKIGNEICRVLKYLTYLMACPPTALLIVLYIFYGWMLEIISFTNKTTIKCV